MKPAKFLGIDERKNGSKPLSPGAVPSRLTARGRNGTDFERSVLSTIESQRRSGIGSACSVDLDTLDWTGAKATAEATIEATRAAEKVFMVDFAVLVACNWANSVRLNVSFDARQCKRRPCV